MVSLVEYRNYWQGVLERVPSVRSLVPVTVDQDISHYLSSLSADQFPVLFLVVPEAQGTGPNVDAFTDRNEAMVLLADKYDPQRAMGAYQLLEDLQPAIEDIKQVMFADMTAGCPLLADVDLRSIRTAPVSSLYNILAGWILSFTFLN